MTLKVNAPAALSLTGKILKKLLTPPMSSLMRWRADREGGKMPWQQADLQFARQLQLFLHLLLPGPTMEVSDNREVNWLRSGTFVSYHLKTRWA
jgi:hypothetical protein